MGELCTGNPLACRAVGGRECLMTYLQGEHVVIVERRKASVKTDDERLDGDEQTNDLSCVARVAAVQEPSGVIDVQEGDDGFLAGEDGLLNALHDLHRAHIGRVMARYQAEFEDNDRRVQQNAIDYDHYEN